MKRGLKLNLFCNSSTIAYGIILCSIILTTCSTLLHAEPTFLLGKDGKSYTAIAGPIAAGPGTDGTFVIPYNPCCNQNCNSWNQSGCSGGGHCCSVWGPPTPCEGSWCQCYGHACPATCAVGGAPCPDICYTGDPSAISACESLVQSIIAVGMAACEAAMNAGMGSFSVSSGGSSITIGCPAGSSISSCSPIYEACTITGCADCFWCQASGLGGVQAGCSNEPSCQPEEIVCENECCPADQECVNGACVEAGCPPGQSFCEGLCCSINQVCIDGSCQSPPPTCPLVQICGENCCPSGQFCLDYETGTCGTNQVPECPPTQQCNEVCCGEGTTCCGGTCCPDEQCSEGVCGEPSCPPTQLCGSECCSPSEICVQHEEEDGEICFNPYLIIRK